jgi:hypothetical protein
VLTPPLVLSEQGSIKDDENLSNQSNLQVNPPHPPETELTPPVGSPTSPFVPVIPSVGDLPKAKPTSRFGLPFDFPNPFSFKKAKTPVNPTEVPMALPNNESFDSNKTEDLLQSIASTPEPSPNLPELPILTPEEEFHDSLGSNGDADSVQEDPYPEPSGWEDPDYSPSEPPSPEISHEFPENPEKPPHLIVNLTKEEWTEVHIYGLPSRPEDPWEFYTDPDQMPYEGVNLYLDVNLSFQELHWETKGNDVYVLAPLSSKRVIPVRFFLAADSGQGKVLLERNTQSPESSSTPGRFFFQRQLPLDQRVQRPGQNSSQNRPEPQGRAFAR